MKHSLYLAASILMIGLSTTGCTATPETNAAASQTASTQQVETRGTYVTDAQLESIEAGDSQADVLELIGEPQNKLSLPPSKEIWSYEFVEIRDGAVIQTSNVIVEFDSEKRVTKAYREAIARAAD